MNKKYFFFLLMGFIPFFSYIFLHPAIMGNDGYDYLSQICNGTHLRDAYGIATPLFSALPCNLIAIKAFLGVLSIISLYLITKNIEEKQKWLAITFIYFIPAWFLVTMNLENEQIAYPFIFLGLYYTIKNKFLEINWNTIKSTALFGIAGAIWKGTPIIFLIQIIRALTLLRALQDQ